MNKLKIVKDRIAYIEEQTYEYEISERYLQRLLLKGTNKQTLQMELGKAQGQIKANKEYLEFLNSVILKELNEKE